LISPRQSPTITAGFPHLGADMVLTRTTKGTGAKMAKLTKRVVDAAKADGNAHFIWDHEIKGFGLRVAPGGAKSYVLNFRNGRGRKAPQHRITIGKHGTWTPEQARREARRLLGTIAAGDNPAATRKAEARAMPLVALCELYLAEGAMHKKPTTLRVDRGRIKNHIVPLLGKLRVDHISRSDVERMQRMVAAGGTAVPVPQQRRRGNLAQGGRGVAAQCVAILGAVMTFGVERKLIDSNPVHGVKKPPSRCIEQFLSEAETARLGEALEAEAKATNDPYPAAAIRLLFFTGCRRSEILSLRWEWVDFDRAMIVLPDSKTGKKTVYLNAPALEVLANLPRQLGNPHVICGHRAGGAFVGLQKVCRRIQTAAGLQGVRLHDLRQNAESRKMPSDAA
jgi:integrase